MLAFKDNLIFQDERTDEVSGLSLPMCNLRIHRGTLDCLPPMQGVRTTEPWRWDWAARTWIIGEGSSGTLVSWVNNAYTCVMIASV